MRRARSADELADVTEPGTLELIAVDVAHAAAAILRERTAEVRVVATKSSPTDIVTNLDTDIEDGIRAALSRRTPRASLLAEEDGLTRGETSVGWIVDPIDGTVNLAYDLPVVAVSVAATVGGRVVAGCVVDVVRDEVFSAASDRGARRNGSRITVSRVEDLAQSLVATGFSYTSDGRADEARVLTRVLPAARDIRCYGSTALQLCWVACGRVDAFYQRHTRQWDYAAGALIAAEAGARVEAPNTANNGLLVAAPLPVFGPLHELVT